MATGNAENCADGPICRTSRRSAGRSARRSSLGEAAAHDMTRRGGLPRKEPRVVKGVAIERGDFRKPLQQIENGTTAGWMRGRIGRDGERRLSQNRRISSGRQGLEVTTPFDIAMNRVFSISRGLRTPVGAYSRGDRHHSTNLMVAGVYHKLDKRGARAKRYRLWCWLRNRTAGCSLSVDFIACRW